MISTTCRYTIDITSIFRGPRSSIGVARNRQESDRDRATAQHKGKIPPTPSTILRRPERGPSALSPSRGGLKEVLGDYLGGGGELLVLPSGVEESFWSSLQGSKRASGPFFRGRESSWDSLPERVLGALCGGLRAAGALGARISTTPIEDRGRIDIEAMSKLCRHSVDIISQGGSLKIVAEVMSKQYRSYVEIVSILFFVFSYGGLWFRKD